MVEGPTEVVTPPPSQPDPEGFAGAFAPAFAPSSWDMSQIVANLLRNDIAWSTGNVPFSFYQSLPAYDVGDPELAGFAPFTPTQISAVTLALQSISDVANITFTNLPDSQSYLDKLNFANSSTYPNFAWGGAQTLFGGAQVNGLTPIRGAEIWVNSDYISDSWAPGGYNLMALIHEIGHAIGVAHPGAYNANGSPITYGSNAEYAQDSRQYTVMSYFDAFNTGADHVEDGRIYFASTPLLHDIAALQALYGANTASRSGDTIYGFGSTAGSPAYDFSSNTRPVVTIWDGGGWDAINLSASPGDQGAQLDLREGAFSNVLGLTGNLSIAYGVVIENGYGTVAADVIIGNGANNVLSGFSGNDRLDGGEGHDSLFGGGGDDVILGGPGIDSIDGGFDWDTVDYSSIPSYVTVDLRYSTQQNTDGGGLDTIDGVEHVIGSNYDDRLWGDSVGNKLYGMGGDDQLDGGLGNDTLDGGSGFDTANYGSATSYVTIDLDYGSVQNTDAAGLDTFASIERVIGGNYDDRFWGSDANNFLHGGIGQDQLNGRGGEDLLDGGANHDILTGGSGPDVFVFRSTSDTHWDAPDRITDFAPGDRIDIGDIDADTTVGGDQAFHIAVTPEAAGVYISYDAGSNRTTLRLDINGDGNPDGRIWLDGDHRGLTNGAFVL